MCIFSPVLILFHFSHVSSSLLAKHKFQEHSSVLTPPPPLFLFTSPPPSFSPVHQPLTCDTPARAWWAFFWSPQLPVAREYLSPSVMILVLMASSRLKSFPRSMNFWAYSLTSFIKLRNNLGTLTTTSHLAKNHNLHYLTLYDLDLER